MRVVKKPWGHEEIWAETEYYVGKFLIIEPNKRLSLQKHTEKDETVMLIRGDAFFTYNNVTEPMRLFVETHVPPGTVHRIQAGMWGATIAEVSTPETGETIRLEDDYGREDDTA